MRSDKKECISDVEEYNTHEKFAEFEIHQKIAKTFQESWESLGGTYAKTVLVDRSNFSQSLKESFSIDESENRATELEKLINQKFKFVPTRRNDIDAIFLATNPTDARQIKPILKYYFAGDIPVFSTSLAILIILPLLSFVIGGVSLSFEIPVLKQLAKTAFIYEGGVGIPPELIALTLALSLYTATFIAECVRAGIQGVGKGQKEAAASIGLNPNQILKLVVMPQALRIIIPPTTNQYLNLTKNSSLAAAIAYPDLVLVFAGTALMQTGKAIEIVSITMLTYLSISLSISVLMNWYNKKIAIKEK